MSSHVSMEFWRGGGESLGCFFFYILQKHWAKKIKNLSKDNFPEEDTPDKSSQGPSHHPGYSHAGYHSIAQASLHLLIDRDEV